MSNRKVYKNKQGFIFYKKGLGLMGKNIKKREVFFTALILSMLIFVFSAYGAFTSGVAGSNPTPAAFTPIKSDEHNLYTGDMKTSISLGEVEGRGGLSLPIVLGYSAGVQVDEEASWTGLGWNIGFGAITRSVNGVPDDSEFGYLNRDFFCYPKNDPNAQSYTTDYYYYETQCSVDYYLDRRDLGRIDSYYLTFGDSGGRLLVSQTPTYWPNSGTPPSIKSLTSNFYTQNWRPLKISFNLDTDGQIRKWIVTAEDGTTYVFDYFEDTNITNEQRIVSFKQDISRREDIPYDECHDLIDNDNDGRIDSYSYTKYNGEQIYDATTDPGCISCPNGPESCANPPVATQAQCSDLIDNDGDTKIDYPNDPDCTSLEDNSESSTSSSSSGGGGGGGSPFAKKKPTSSEPLEKSPGTSFFDFLKNLFTPKTATQGDYLQYISLRAGPGFIGEVPNPGCFGAPGFGDSTSGQWPTEVSSSGKHTYKAYYNYAGCVKSSGPNSNGPSIKYRTTWLLTEIRSPDFVDSNSNGIADDADKGNYIKITYRKGPVQEFVTLFNPSSLDENWRNLTSVCMNLKLIQRGDPDDPDDNVNLDLTNYDLKDDNGNQIVEDCEWNSNNHYLNFYRTMAYSRTHTNTQFSYIDRIDTPVSYAKFITSPRYDLVSIDGNYANVEKLDKIEIYDKSTNSLLYNYLFEYNYDLAKGSINKLTALNPNGGKLTLSKVKVQDALGTLALPPYEFTYGYNPNNNIYAKDWWGYYNGKTTNNGLVCSTANPSISTLSGLTCAQLAFNYNECYAEQLRGACRLGGDFEPDTNMANAIASAWSLTKVKYPTGGEISYAYEPDTYSYLQDVALPAQKTGGGVRLKSVTTDNKLKDVQTTTYLYGQNSDGTGLSSGVATQNSSIQAGSLWAFTNIAPHAQNYVAYSRVTTLLPGGYGRQSVEFYTPKDYPDTDLDSKANAHSFSEWKRGQVKSTKSYGADASLVVSTQDTWDVSETVNYVSQNSASRGDPSGSNVCQGNFISCQSRTPAECGAGCSQVGFDYCAGPGPVCKDKPDDGQNYIGECQAVYTNTTRCMITSGPHVEGITGFTNIYNTWVYYGQICDVYPPPCQGRDQASCSGTEGTLIGCQWVHTTRCTDTSPPTRYCNKITLSDCDEKKTGCSPLNDKVVSSGWPRLLKQESSVDGITNVVDYVYNQKNGLVDTKTETNSNSAEKRITKTLYTVDFPDAASGAGFYPRYYPEMIAKNMISLPALVETYKDSKTSENKLTQSHTYYKDFDTSTAEQWRIDEQNVQEIIYNPTGGPTFGRLFKTVFNSYDSYGNILKVTDPISNVVETAYDSTYHARPIKGWNSVIGSSTSPAWELSYDIFGNVLSSKDENTKETRYVYDTLGRLTGIKRPTPTGGLESTPSTSYVYNYVGGALSSSNLNYVNTKQAIKSGVDLNTYSYADGLGTTLNNTIVKSDPGVPLDELYSNVEYNEIGKVKKTPMPFFKTAPSTKATTNIYKADPLARVDKIVPPGGNTADNYIKYDYLNDLALGHRVVKVTDEEGKITESYYDKFGNLVKSKDAAGFFTTYEYDRLGRLTKVTNPELRVTTNKYDSLGRLTQTSSPDFGDITYSYDENGNKKTKTQNSQITSYDYDKQNRLIKVTYFEGDFALYEYDVAPSAPCGARTTYPKGRLSKISDRSGVSCLYYDAKGQLDYKTKIIDGKSHNFDFDFDLAGNIISVQDPLGILTTYSYNSLNQLESVTSKGKTVKYEYNPIGTIDKITFPNSVITDYSYNPREWVTSVQTTGLKDQNNAPLIFSDIVDYDKVGNVKTRTDSIGTSVFTYDNLYRLTGVSPPTGQPITGVYDTFSYTYDKIGNRKTENSNVYTFTPNTNRLSSVTNSPYNTISSSFTYDANGNLRTQTKRQEGAFCKGKADASGHYFLYGIDMDVGTAVRVVYDVKKDTDGLAHHYEWNTLVQAYNGGEKCGPDFYATTFIDLSDASKFTGYPSYQIPPALFYSSTHQDSYFRIYTSNTYTTTYDFNSNNELTKINYQDGTCDKFLYDADGVRVKKTESKDFDFGQVTILSNSAEFPITKPSSITSDNSGNVYFGSYSTSSGNLIRCNSDLSICAVILTGIKYNSAVAFDKTTQNLLVNHKNSATSLYFIHKVNKDTGVIISTWSSFNRAVTSIATSTGSRMFVGTLDGYVQIYDTSSATPVLLLEKQISGAGEIWGVDVDHIGNIYVSGLTGNKIYKLDSSLNVLNSYGTGTAICNYVYSPRAIGISGDGSIYVVENTGQRLYKLDPSLKGYKLEIFGVCQSSGSTSDKLNLPSDVHINSNAIYVADTDNNRILKFNSAKKGFVTRYVFGGDVEYQENAIDNAFSCV